MQNILMHSIFFSQDKLPLAVVGSNTIMDVNGKRVRGRQYPWGVAEGTRVYPDVMTPQVLIRLFS